MLTISSQTAIQNSKLNLFYLSQVLSEILKRNLFYNFNVFCQSQANTALRSMLSFRLTVTLNTHFKAFQVDLIQLISKNIVLNSLLFVLPSMTYNEYDQKSCLPSCPKTVAENRARKNLPSDDCQGGVIKQSSKVEMNLNPVPSNTIKDLAFNQKLNHSELSFHKGLAQEQRQKQPEIQKCSESEEEIKQHKRQNDILESGIFLFPVKENLSLGYEQSAIVLQEVPYNFTSRFSALENDVDSTIASDKSFHLKDETQFLDSQITEDLDYQKFIGQLLSNLNDDQNHPDFQIEHTFSDIGQDSQQYIKLHEQLWSYLEQMSKDE